jgi:hypothetical protein
MLKMSAFGLAAGSLVALDKAGLSLTRLEAHAAPATLPDIQYDIVPYLGPVQTIEGVQFRMGPMHSTFVTATLKRNPTKQDQTDLAADLKLIEDNYPFSPAGIFLFIAYGIPYFNRLPGGIQGSLVSKHMPRLLGSPNRAALEEAVPAPTDVTLGNPSPKPTFNIPVKIEGNDMLLTLRSDKAANVAEVIAWLKGTGTTLNGRAVRAAKFKNLCTITSERSMFAIPGQTRALADQHNFSFAPFVNPKASMWMGFADNQVDGSGPAEITTFQGNASARLTDAEEGNYFYNGSIQHLSHVILDLEQFYGDGPGPIEDEPYLERVQYMFRSNPPPSLGFEDQFTDGGGTAFLPNEFKGVNDAEENAKGNTISGEPRMGHTTALQRSSRALDGTPIHIRADGPGFDSMDMPGGALHPKLQFSIFVPTAEFFRAMRENAAALDLVEKYGVEEDDNGLEFFITPTRRQNFLVPPRRNRAFPLVEFVKTTTHAVTDGYDSKLRKRLSQDGKVYMVTSSDNQYWENESGYFTAFQFEGGIPTNATITSVKVYVKHYEEEAISANSLV